MPPKRQGPVSENTAKRPRAQGPIKRRHASQAQSKASGYTHIEVPSENQEMGNEGRAMIENNNNDTADNLPDYALTIITELRSEGHATAIGSGHHRKQYSKVFKLAALTYW
ncbi:hypothetical protein L211DRAFT_835943, partial [Terfezia boudieri ATCC MYA-4762]